MPPSTFALSILQHTPVWVWALLLALVWLGLRQAGPRSVTLRRLVAMPLAMLALSLWSVVSAFGSPAALAAWALGALASAAVLLRANAPRGARWSAAEQHLQLPGSWLPLALILGIFCTKFAVGVSLALHPELRSEAGLALGASLAYGAFSGFFAGRALALLRLARPTPQARAA